LGDAIAVVVGRLSVVVDHCREVEHRVVSGDGDQQIAEVAQRVVANNCS
jgi:hypothetical protein